MQDYNKLIEYATKKYGINVINLKSRKAEVIRIRHSIGTILCSEWGYTTVEVGRILKVDHSTIIHYRDNHIYRYRSDDEYARIYDDIRTFNVPNEASLNEILQLIKNIA